MPGVTGRLRGIAADALRRESIAGGGAREAT